MSHILTWHILKPYFEALRTSEAVFFFTKVAFLQVEVILAAILDF